MSILAASRALGIAEEAQFTKLPGQGIVGHQTTNQRITDIEQELDGLGCLQHANNAWQHAQYTGFCAAWRKLWRRRLWIETAITRSIVGLEDGQLALEAEDAAMHDGLVSNQRSIIQQIASGEIICAVKNHVVVGYDACHVGFVQALDMCNDFYIWVQRFYGFTGRISFVLTHTLRVM